MPVECSSNAISGEDKGCFEVAGGGAAAVALRNNNSYCKEEKEVEEKEEYCYDQSDANICTLNFYYFDVFFFVFVRNH